MVAIDGLTVAAHLASGDAATNSFLRGQALEALGLYIFTLVPGVDFFARDELNVFGTEEVDLVLSNDQLPEGLHFLPFVLIVECKNSNQAVPSDQVAYFAHRIRQRGSDLGILIAAHGVSGIPEPPSAGHYEIVAALQDGVRILIMTREDIENVSSTEELVELLKIRLLTLTAFQKAIP